MPTPPPHTPAERFAAILHRLGMALGARTGWDRVLHPLIGLIITRFCHARQRFAALAARIAAGRYKPRRPPAKPHHRRPPKSALPTHFAWLLPLLPGAGGVGSELDNLLREPDMQALMAAAPEPMGKILRPICRMLGVVPPPILARPRRAPAPRPKEKIRGEGSPPTPKPALPKHPHFKRKPSANWPGRKTG